MVARLVRLLRALLWGALGLAAALGVALSGLAALAGSSVGRPVAARLLVGQIEAALAGRFTLEGFELLPQGGIELRGLEVHDPAGRLVLQISRARLRADLTRLGVRELGVDLELAGPTVLLETGADGRTSLLEAFAPRHPGPPTGDGAPHLAWTLRLTRLTLRDGDVRWQAADGSSQLEASGVAVDAQAAYGPRGGFLELTGRGSLEAPAEGPFTVQVSARLAGDRLELPVLSASLGPTAVAGLAEADLKTRTFRAALSRSSVAGQDAIRLVPALGAGPAALTEGAQVEATGYAESDGHRLTAALEARAGQGTARLAAALDLAEPRRALGLDVALADFDPSRLVAQAPPARLTLTARGALAGTRPADARGRLELEVAPSTVRAGALGPLSLRASAAPGLIEVSRLDGRLPGLTVAGQGVWREGGAVSGRFTLEAGDLGRAGANLEALLGQAWPQVAGRLTLTAEVSGTSAAPRLAGALVLPRLVAGGFTAEGGRLEIAAAGPLAQGSFHVGGVLARATAGGVELRGARLDVGLADEAVVASVSSLLPGLGPDPATLDLAGRLTPGRRGLSVSALSLGWPGARYALVRPALVIFDPLAVDRLELADGDRSLAFSGGFGARRTVDARLEATRLDLARLPRGLLPPDLALAGVASLDVRATGLAATPRLSAHLVLEGGAVRGLEGLRLAGDLCWDVATHRLTADLGLVRAAGGTLDVTGDLRLPLDGAPAAEPLSLTVAAAGWPSASLAAATQLELPASGRLGARLTLAGTAGAPTVEATVTLDEARRLDLGPVDLSVALKFPAAGPGGAGRAELTAAVRRAGTLLASARASTPLDGAALLARPGATLERLREAPLEADLDLPGADLAPFAGQGALPEGLAGTLSGHATLRGTTGAPRGTVHLAVADLRWPGWPVLSGEADLTLEEARTALTATATAGGAPALRLEGALGAAIEALARRATLTSAPLTLTAEVPDLPLERTAGAEPYATGVLSASLEAHGTLAAPEARLDAAARGVVVEGKPLGDLGVALRTGGGRATAALTLAASAGGTLAVDASLAARLGLDSTVAGLGQAELSAHATATGLELGALVPLLPGLLRAASGRITLDVAVDGRLEALRPRGSVEITDGRLAIAEYGDWTEVGLAVTVGERSVEVTRLSAHKGKGQVSGTFSAHDLGLATSHLTGQVTFKKLTLSRAGVDFATLDLPLTITGSWTAALLDATVTSPGGTVQLPKKTPRTLQSLEQRPDITVGRPRPQRAALRPAVAVAAPLVARFKLVVPGKLFVKREAPRLNVELKTESTWTLTGGNLTAEGPDEVVRGTVEPISGRVFVVERGKVQFNGAGVLEGQIDAAATWENPAATVTVVVAGPLRAPTVQLTSKPALDDTSIAILIATGRTELKAGTTDISSMDAKAASYAAGGAAFTYLFQSAVREYLPLDMVAIDSGALRAGKYLTDRFFVGYTRRFDANPELYENSDEVRVEYQLTKRWTLESRYGNAQTGGASLIWQNDY